MKKLFWVFAFAALATAANAAAVRWTVDTSIDYDAATLVTWNGEAVPMYIYTTTGISDSTLIGPTDLPVYSAIDDSSITITDALQFSVQLMKWDETKSKFALVAESTKVSYGELMAENAVFLDIMQTPTASVHTFSEFAVIPEPTSAMMLLLGLAGLALKRKNA